MGWETRSGHRYYYRKRRDGDRVVSEYVGTGELAEALGRYINLDRNRETLERALWKLECADLDQPDEALDGLYHFTRDLATVVLIATGHHTHKREWRQWRMASDPEPTELEKLPTTVEEIRALLKAVDKRKPDKKAVAQFRALLQHSGIWRVAGDTAVYTANKIIEQAGGESQSVKMSMNAGLAELHKQLGYDTAPPLQRILIEQVALAWLRHNWVEYQFQGFQPHSMPIARALYWERKLSASQRRFLRACEALARVQKLADRTPALQINFADKQLNVSQSS